MASIHDASRRLFTLRPGRPGDRRPGVSSYRVFMTVVFLSVVAVDAWCDRSLPGLADIVGPVSTLVWVLTVLGSFGIGPIATLWRSQSR